MPNSPTDRNEFDVIVLGVGGMGSAACCELARRGLHVLGLEQFSLAHDRGSSHGDTRIIRKAYFEHPDYVPLLHRAYELWQQLEQATGRTLYLPTGLVLSGPADGETIRGARLSAQLHGLELENYTPSEAHARFPGFAFPADHDVAFEPGAGTLLVEECVRAHVDEATRHGATLLEHEPAVDWSVDGDQVRVRTATSEYVARRLVITAGAWAQQCLKDLGLRLQVLRKFVGWFAVNANDYQASRGLPTFFYEMPEGCFYGFPSFDEQTLKVAEHTGGELVADPATVDRDCQPSDVTRMSAFINAQLPKAGLSPVRHSVCLYTMTTDHHFVVDVHPRWKNVVLAAGFSGHGFKFCPVVGEVLADLVQHGKTTLPIEFLSLSRPTLQP